MQYGLIKSIQNNQYVFFISVLFSDDYGVKPIWILFDNRQYCVASEIIPNLFTSHWIEFEDDGSSLNKVFRIRSKFKILKYIVTSTFGKQILNYFQNQLSSIHNCL